MLVLKTAPLWQWIGRRFARPFAGILIVEAEKEVFALSKINKKKVKKKLIHIPGSALPA